MSRPQISVVMSVFNSAPDLDATLTSVLSQSDCDFEMIVIDDGSTDRSAFILDDAASRESRLKVVHQENRGLTRSLIRGCELARGDFIARQDAGGDLSMPGRLAALLELARDDRTVLTSSGVRYFGPHGEVIVDEIPSSSDQTESLLTLDADSLRGPAHHGSTLFRTSAYRRVGGYRSAFSVAQDLDLWVRLAETGRHMTDPDILYQATLTADSLTSLYRPLQRSMARLILDCARRRRQGRSEDRLLNRARRARRSAPRGLRRRLYRSRTLYFIASCLASSDPASAAVYFKASIREFPLNGKSWWRLLARA